MQYYISSPGVALVKYTVSTNWYGPLAGSATGGAQVGKNWIVTMAVSGRSAPLVTIIRAESADPKMPLPRLSVVTQPLIGVSVSMGGADVVQSPVRARSTKLPKRSRTTAEAVTVVVPVVSAMARTGFGAFKSLTGSRCAAFR